MERTSQNSYALAIDVCTGWAKRRRFGCRWSSNNLPRELDHSSSNFYRGSKSAKFGLMFNVAHIWAARVWKCSKISQLWNKFLTRQWSLCVAAKFGKVRSTHPWEPSGESTPPPRTGRQKCAKWSITLPRIVHFAQILHRVGIRDAGSTTKIQGQGVKGQGHSET